LSQRRNKLAPALLLLALLVFSAVSGSAARSARGDSQAPAVSPTDFAGLVLMSGFRPIAVDILWIRAEDLYKQRRYYELLSLYRFISSLDPHFESAWVYNTLNLAFDLSMLEDTPEKRWSWVREALLYAKNGAGKNPGSDEIPFVIAWVYRYRIPREEHMIRRVLLDRELNPEGKPVIELARGWAERAFRMKPHVIYIDWLLESLYREYGDHAVKASVKLDYLQKRLEIWRYVKANKPLAAKKAEEKIRLIESEIDKIKSGS